MRLIDADELKRKYAGWYNVYGKGRSIRCVETKEIDWMPTIPAIPIDKLCELCEETDVRVPCVLCGKIMPEWCKQNNSLPLSWGVEWKCPTWKQLLTKWMEEQNEG